jgi:hypothetical protein
MEMMELLNTLHAINQEIIQLAAVGHYKQALTQLAIAACDLLDGETSAIWLLEDGWLLLHATDANQSHAEKVPLYESLIGESVLARAPVKSDDVRIDKRLHHPELAAQFGWMKALIVPILIGPEDEPVGAINVYCSEDLCDETASDEQMQILTLLADLAAMVIVSATRHQVGEASETPSRSYVLLGDLATSLLVKLRVKAGAIPVRIEGIQDKCGVAVAADAYLSDNLVAIQKNVRESLQVVGELLSLMRMLSSGETAIPVGSDHR